MHQFHKLFTVDAAPVGTEDLSCHAEQALNRHGGCRYRQVSAGQLAEQWESEPIVYPKCEMLASSACVSCER